MSHQALIEIKGLTKLYAKDDGKKFAALNKLSLSIPKKHHLISLIGPDGAGKSTLLKFIAGLIKADEGEFNLYLDELTGDVEKSLEAEKSLDTNTISLSFSKDKNVDLSIGYMSQNLGLYEDLSVWDNLILFSQLRDIDVSKLGDVGNDALKAKAQGEDASVCKGLGGLDAKSQLSLESYLNDLLQRAGLFPFKERKAGALSGGMKQKLALTCAISAKPRLLLLDEPTVGVDPISRRELWKIILDYIEDSGSYCLFSSLYLEEAERGTMTIFIKQGEIIYSGSAEDLRTKVQEQCYTINLGGNKSYQKVARNMMCKLELAPHIIDICPRLGRIDLLLEKGCSRDVLEKELKTIMDATSNVDEKLLEHEYELTTRPSILEDAYINLTYDPKGKENLTKSALTSPDNHAHEASQAKPIIEDGKEVVISVDGVKKTFGSFTAVASSYFKVYKGEIFGLLGPNGAGKTTTFRMICALLNPTAGTILINNMSLKDAKSSVRATIGYVAQKFCLYRKLTTLQNLVYFGKSYGLSGATLDQRIKDVSDTFGLEPFLNEESINLPFGIQRSLSMACALIHRPSILFLDEATSGADPTSRRTFWAMIARLASQGTTIIVTTHFMEEAEYCDRFLIQDQGKILILGSPDEICNKGASATESDSGSKSGRISIEEAFINCVNMERAHKS